MRTQAADAPELRPTFERRWLNVLTTAEHNQHAVVVLGAWGCGAFQNDPSIIAIAARAAVSSPRFSGAFRHVVFAIPGTGKRSQQNLEAFREVFSA